MSTTLFAADDVNYSKPTYEEISAVCDFIAAPDKNNKEFSFPEPPAFDINNDGIVENVKVCWGGTMNNPCFEYSIPEGEEIYANPEGYEWKDYWTHGLTHISFQGKTYSAHFKDKALFMSDAHPVYVSYMTPDNVEYVICELDTRTEEQFIAIDDEYGVCDSKIEDYYQFDGMSSFEYGDFREKYNLYETGAKGVGRVDFDNDGKQEILVKMEHSSGAGRGCGMEYYMVTTKTRDELPETEEQNILRKATEMGGLNCNGNLSNWFEYNGKIYYENKDSGYSDSPYHRVILIEYNEPKLVCESQFKSYSYTYSFKPF